MCLSRYPKPKKLLSDFWSIFFSYLLIYLKDKWHYWTFRNFLKIEALLLSPRTPISNSLKNFVPIFGRWVSHCPFFQNLDFILDNPKFLGHSNLVIVLKIYSLNFFFEIFLLTFVYINKALVCLYYPCFRFVFQSKITKPDFAKIKTYLRQNWGLE